MGNSLSCNSPLTKPCLGEKDPRYNPNVSNNLIEQNPIWGQYAGYWGPTQTNAQLSDGSPRLPALHNITSGEGWPYKSDAFKGFRLIKIDGSRYTVQGVYVYEPAPDYFCDQSVPAGMKNALGNDVCGENGHVSIIEEFGTSSYEKDGSVNIIWESTGPTNDAKSGPSSIESVLNTVDDYSVFKYTSIPGLFTITVAETFLDEDNLLGVGSGAVHLPGSANFQRLTTSILSPRIKEDLFFKELKQAYIDANVAEIPGWLTAGGSMPSCLAAPWGICPDESNWCSSGNDPNCSKSIYQEPTVSLTAGGLALVVIVVIIVAVTVSSAINYRIAKKRINRYKTAFAGQMAERVSHRASVGQLTPSELEEEFNRIDSGLEGGNGQIEKDELWNFISTEKAGHFSKKDFESLFSAMDVDKDGSINFLEFCSFMTSCQSEFEKKTAKGEKVSLLTRSISMKKLI